MNEDKQNQPENNDSNEQSNERVKSPPAPPENVLRTYGDNGTYSNKSTGNKEGSKKG